APRGPVQGINKLRSMIADHRHAGPERDAGLKREAGDCDNVPPSRHSTPSVQSKASSYAFFTSVINSPRRQRRSTVLRRLSPFPAHEVTESANRAVRGAALSEVRLIPAHSRRASGQISAHDRRFPGLHPAPAPREPTFRAP